MIDQLNGFLITKLGITISISQMLKSIYLLGMLAYVMVVDRHKFLVLLGFTLVVFLPILSNLLFYSKRIIFLYDDIAFVSKLLTFPVSYYFFISVAKKYPFIQDNIKRHANTFFFIILVALIFSLLGFGNSNYGQVGGAENEDGMSYGYKGYFIAGNELSALFVLLYAFFCYYLYKNFKSIFLVSGGLIIGLLAAGLIVTKTALAGYVVISIGTPFFIKYQESKSVFSYTKYDKKFLKIFIILPLFISVVLYSLFQERIEANISRIQYNIAKADELSSFLLSGRDNRVKNSVDLFVEKYAWYEKMFGTGWEYPKDRIKAEMLGIGTAELDYLDLLISNGIIGLLLVYGFWVVVLLKMTSAFLSKNRHSLISPALLGFTLLFFLSFISGHIMYSAMVGFYLGYFVTPLNMKKELILIA
ncbi:O-antigen ligase-like membrane protein [Chitinophaga skermanii]|uniref:O-antigen ligase-like membrane protein n=1 Tax=Chitinophaga skermanii TaxID=331697 RepID=A0A327R0Y6_9BACT|nr:O-antigen ligase-like membrane protein [Chitinophaga skermanii]